MTKIRVKAKDGAASEFEFIPGTSVMQSMKAAGMEIEAACEGSLACATCHIILSPESYAALGAPAEDEEGMLDTLMRVTRTSRLACQIRPSADVALIEIEEIVT